MSIFTAPPTQEDVPHVCGESNHDFQPRYTLSVVSRDCIEAALEQVDDDIVVSDVLDVIEALQPKTYVHDICIHCGKSINGTILGTTSI